MSSISALLSNKRRYVYLIRSHETGYYKIGISNDPYKRVAQLQTGSAVKLELIHCFLCEDAEQTEAFLHDKFSDKRLMGEWFSLNDSDVKEIKDLNIENLSYLYRNETKSGKKDEKKKTNWSGWQK